MGKKSQITYPIKDLWLKKEFSNVNKKTNHPIFLMVKRFEHFTKEDIQVT